MYLGRADCTMPTPFLLKMCIQHRHLKCIHIYSIYSLVSNLQWATRFRDARQSKGLCK